MSGPLAPPDLDARERLALELARDAGALALRYFRHALAYHLESKGPQDWVSEADRAVERLVRGAIAAAFPGDHLLGEEDGGTVGERSWLFDPIDGTINFVHGVRYWCVSIAFIVNGVREIGVVHDPATGELFHARRGGGAWSDGERLRVSACNALDRALLAVGYVPRHGLDEHLVVRRRLLDAGAALKDMGAGALMLAHVAAGRYDGYYEPHMFPWDATAGLLLIEEAGGRVGPYPGPYGLAVGGRVLASAPLLFDRLHALCGA